MAKSKQKSKQKHQSNQPKHSKQPKQSKEPKQTSKESSSSHAISRKPPVSQKTPVSRKRMLVGLGVLAALVALIVVVAPMVSQNRPPDSEATTTDTMESTTESTAESVAEVGESVDAATTSSDSTRSPEGRSGSQAPKPLPIGHVTGCQHNPDFTDDLGFQTIAIDTSRSRGVGIVLFDFAATDTFAPENIYQHETWDDVGVIGSYVLDGAGNLYGAPFPYVDIGKNPLSEQNVLHRIDTTTGVMDKFLALPNEGETTTANPFGIVALTYDCETESIYAASLAGSTRAEELGRISQIDSESGQVIAQLAGMDPYGLAVFNGVSGKRLYFGHARSGDVLSIELDANGRFVGEPKVIFSLAEFYSAHALIARRISFREEQMKVDGLRFQYNLVPMAEQGPRPSFTFDYDDANDSWTFVEMQRNDY